MSTQMKKTDDQLIFRKTNARKGRHISITPENSAMKHLVYGRIILDREKIRTMHANGESVRAIAAQVGVSKSLIANILTR